MQLLSAMPRREIRRLNLRSESWPMSLPAMLEEHLTTRTASENRYKCL